jgi:membrane protease YdiL (CAAX protease family)
VNPEEEEKEKAPEVSTTQKVLLAIYCTVVIVALLILVASLPVGLYTVFYTRLSGNVTYAHSIHQLYFYIGLSPIFIPVQSTVGTAFIGYYTLYAILIGLAAVQARNIASAVKLGVKKGFGGFMSNPLLGTIILLGALLFATFLVDIVQTSAGVQVGGLSGDPLELFLSIVIAPLAEEIGFRLALIGIPMFIIGLLAAGPSRAVRALWRPSAVWEDTPQGSTSGGTKTLAKVIAYVTLALSSVLFGLAHYVSGAGWGIGKITEAGVAGLILGYAYIRYGFHSDIIMHWSVNNLTAYDFFSQGVWKIPWDSSTGNNLTLAVEGFVVYVLGAPSLALVAYRLIRRTLVRRETPLQTDGAPPTVLAYDEPGRTSFGQAKKDAANFVVDQEDLAYGRRP